MPLKARTRTASSSSVARSGRRASDDLLGRHRELLQRRDDRALQGGAEHVGEPEGDDEHDEEDGHRVAASGLDTPKVRLDEDRAHAAVLQADVLHHAHGVVGLHGAGGRHGRRRLGSAHALDLRKQSAVLAVERGHPEVRARPERLEGLGHVDRVVEGEGGGVVLAEHRRHGLDLERQRGPRRRPVVQHQPEPGERQRGGARSNQDQGEAAAEGMAKHEGGELP
jgi:hypothetical protein